MSRLILERVRYLRNKTFIIAEEVLCNTVGFSKVTELLPKNVEMPNLERTKKDGAMIVFASH